MHWIILGLISMFVFFMILPYRMTNRKLSNKQYVVKIMLMEIGLMLLASFILPGVVPLYSLSTLNIAGTLFCIWLSSVMTVSCLETVRQYHDWTETGPVTERMKENSYATSLLSLLLIAIGLVAGVIISVS